VIKDQEFEISRAHETRPLAVKVEFKREESTVKIAAPAASPAVIGPVGSDAR